MKPGELTRVEDTLRRAYGDALAAVERDDTSPELLLAMPPGRPPRGAGRPGGRRRWVVPAAAGAAVAVVALVAGLLVPTEVQHPPSPPAPRPASGGSMMAYVAGGRSSFKGPNSVLPVDLATGRVMPPIKVSETGLVEGILRASNGKTIYLVTDTGDVVPVDTTTRKAGPPIRVGDSYGMLISPNGHTGYFMDQFRGVATVNLVTNRPGPFINISHAWAFALTPNGKILYVLTEDGSEVIPLDTATLRTLPPIVIGDNNGPLNGFSARIVVAPDGKMAYLLSIKKGTGQVLTPIDTTTDTALPPISVPASAPLTPITISPDSRSAYLYTGSGVMAVDLTTGKIRWTVALGTSIWSGQAVESPPWDSQTVVSPDSRTVYTHGADNRGVYRIDAASGTVSLIRMGWIGTDLGFGPDGKLYFLSYIAKGTKLPAAWMLWELTRFDPATGAVSPPISLPEAIPESGYDLQFGG